MILIDYSNVAMSCLAVGMRMESGNIMSQGFLLGKIKAYNTKFRDVYGELVIANDHGGMTWRHAYYKHYKAHRVVKDPDEAFIEMMQVRADMYKSLKEHSPYRCVSIRGAEGDDIGGVLARQPGRHMLISADKDWTQICSDTIKCYNPIKKEQIDNGPNYIDQLILSGDPGDGIPNFLSDDDTLVNKEKRQKPLTKKIKEQMYDAFDQYTEIPDLNVKGVTTEQMQKNYIRNQKLIDFRKIPKIIVKQIEDEFHSQEGKHKGKDLMTMILAMKASNYVSCLNDFVPNTRKVEMRF